MLTFTISLAQFNMVSAPKVVHGMNWLTCEREFWKYFTYETAPHIDKILGNGLVYILSELILKLPYDFGNQRTSPRICASPLPIILLMWDFISHMKYFQHYSQNAYHLIALLRKKKHICKWNSNTTKITYEKPYSARYIE